MRPSQENLFFYQTSMSVEAYNTYIEWHVFYIRVWNYVGEVLHPKLMNLCEFKTSNTSYLRSRHREHTVISQLYLQPHLTIDNVTILKHTPSELRNMTIAFTHMQIQQYKRYKTE